MRRRSLVGALTTPQNAIHVLHYILVKGVVCGPFEKCAMHTGFAFYLVGKGAVWYTPGCTLQYTHLPDPFRVCAFTKQMHRIHTVAAKVTAWRRSWGMGR